MDYLFRLLGRPLYTLLLISVYSLFVVPQAHAQRADSEKQYQLSFNDVSVGSAVKILVELSDVNIIVTHEASDPRVSFSVQKMPIKSIIDSLCRIAGLWYRYNNDTGVYIIMSETEYKKDVVIYRKEKTKSFVLKHQNVAYAANAVQALYGDRVTVTSPINDASYKLDGEFGEGDSNSDSSSSSSSSSVTSTNGSDSSSDLSSENLTLSQLAFIDRVEGIRRVNENVLSQISQRVESEIKITYNYLHNLLLIRTSDEEALNEIAELIKDLDRPAKQVLLEVKVLGLDLGDDAHSIFDLSLTSDSTTDGIDSSSNGSPIGGTGSDISSAIAGLGNNALQATNTAVYQLLNDNMIARIQLMESEDRIETVSSPILLASNNKVARIFIGEERIMTNGVSTTGGTTTDGVSDPLYVLAETTLVDVGNELEIWPRINDDRTVTLDLVMENSSVLEDASSIPISAGDGAVTDYDIDSITTTSLELTVIAKEGKTIAIGGMISETSSDFEEKVPFLGDIPFLGYFFTSTSTSRSRTETILLITPYIFETSEEAEEKSLAILKEHSENQGAEELLAEKSGESLFVNSSYAEMNKANLPTIINGLKYVAHSTHDIEIDRPQGLNPGYADFSHWKISADIEGSALQSWQYQGSYITSMVLTNNTYTDKKIDMQWFGEGWLSISVEQEVIEAGEQTVAYLVSSIPAAQLLSQQKMNFMYTASGLLQASQPGNK